MSHHTLLPHCVMHRSLWHTASWWTTLRGTALSLVASLRSSSYPPPPPRPRPTHTSSAHRVCELADRQCDVDGARLALRRSGVALQAIGLGGCDAIGAHLIQLCRAGHAGSGVAGMWVIRCGVAAVRVMRWGVTAMRVLCCWGRWCRAGLQWCGRHNTSKTRSTGDGCRGRPHLAVMRGAGNVASDAAPGQVLLKFGWRK